MHVMLEVKAVEPLEGRSVRLTLSDGTVVERDIQDLSRVRYSTGCAPTTPCSVESEPATGP